MNSRLISCIIPVYNGERYLSEAINSIFEQSYSDLEIIIVDDGSIDDTATIAKSYGDKIRYLRQSNQGPASARNYGIRASTGDLIAFLDADDIWHSEKLAKQIILFGNDSRLEICNTYLKNFWIPELAAEAEYFHDHRLSRPQPGYVFPTLLAEKNVFEKIGFINTDLRHAEDVDWFCRVMDQKIRGDIIKEELVYRRLHKHNTSRNIPDNNSALLNIVKKTLDRRRVK